MKKQLAAVFCGLAIVLAGCNASSTETKTKAKNETAATDTTKETESKDDVLKATEASKQKISAFIDSYNKEVDTYKKEQPSSKVSHIDKNSIEEPANEFFSQDLYKSERFDDEAEYTILASYNENGDLKGYRVSFREEQPSKDGVMKLDTGLGAALVVNRALKLDEEKFISHIDQAIENANGDNKEKISYTDHGYKVTMSGISQLASFTIYFDPITEQKAAN